MTARILKPFALACAVLLAACGVQAAYDDAQVKVEAFHGALDEGKYKTIWSTTSPVFRQVTSEEEFTKLLGAVHDKLGKVRSSTANGWSANNTNGVSTIAVTMNTTFEKGEGTEVFTYLRQGEVLKLQGYNINAPALIYN